MWDDQEHYDFDDSEFQESEFGDLQECHEGQHMLADSGVCNRCEQKVY